MKIDSVEQSLRAGRPVVISTDTVWGLAARVDDSEAIAEIFALKQRPPDVRIAVLVADIAQAAELVELGNVGSALADEFWPGALTIVAARRPGLMFDVGDPQSIGVRCPAAQQVRELARRVGPLAVSSANLHGHPSAATASEVASRFPRLEVLDDGEPAGGAASTVVSVLGPRVSILREGPIEAAAIEAAVVTSS